MYDYLEQLRRKPEAVRTRIAFFSSAAVTGVVALGWMIALVAGDTFTLSPTAPIASLEDGQEAYSALQAAAGAIANPRAESSGLVIVEEEKHSTITEEAPADATVIPF